MRSPFSHWFSGTSKKPAPPATADALPLVAPKPPALNDARQWAGLESVVTGAAATVERVADMQASASRQLDAAGYALHQLLAELATVMTLPSKARTATVVKLPVQPRKVAAEFRRKPPAAAA